MARRSLKASTRGIEKAKRAFEIREWTQEYLASEVGLETRQSIWKFFTGKPIKRQNFMEICFQLGLDWQDIVEVPSQSLLAENSDYEKNSQEIDTLVQILRSRRSDKIQAQCATTRLLDTAKPTKLEDIYVNTNILDNITSQRWLDIFDLQDLDVEELDSFGLSRVSQERLPAIQAVTTHPKLLVLGKPGSGKTTFLQHIALECDRGKLLSDRVPIFISLKNFVEDARETGNFNLLKYITQEFSHCGAGDGEIQTLLLHGRILILLDGLDEISEDERPKIVRKIRKLSEDYYKNNLILSCRVGSHQYRFEGFSDIEIADFDSCQIEAFVQKWFVNVGRNSQEQGKSLATQFIQKLQLSENRQIRELAVTPLLLNLLCCVFQERLDFPARRGELYKQALDILLNRWDKVRSIKRNEIYPYLSLSQKVELLSHIAAITFKQGHYFFTQSNLQQYITDYLDNLPIAETEPDIAQLYSETILKSLETDGLLVEQGRGIYSFSHIGFHEYFAARNIVANPESQIVEEKLIELVKHLTEPRWRRVFLLTLGMLDNATSLLKLMKQHIDRLVAFDKQLQEFLIWLNHKSLSVETSYKSASIRAFYLTLFLPDDWNFAHDLALALTIDSRLASNLPPDLALDLALKCTLQLSFALQHDPALDRVLALNFALPDDRTIVCSPELQSSLQPLKEELPALVQGTKKLQEWWKANGETWANKLRLVMFRCRNIGHEWQFSEQQKQMLKHYYTANQLLIDCLNSSCQVPATVSENILATLLLPIAKVTNYPFAVGKMNGYVACCN